jgi:hypothetical protein
MGGQDSSPNEPSKAYVQSVGRGGVGNLQYAKKFEGMANEPPATRVDHVVPSLQSPLFCNVEKLVGPSKPTTFNWPWWYG